MGVSLSLMLPIGKFYLLNRIECNFLFVATPPNAMIFSSGSVRIADLLKVGFVGKIVGILVIFAVSLVLITPVFHISGGMSISNATLMNGTSG
jgi:hypothetical protein